MKAGALFVVLCFTFNVCHSQSQSKRPGRSAQGSLTVTATVVPSVWLVMEPDGKRDVVVANAPDPKESFYRAAPATKPESVRGRRTQKTSPAGENKTASAVQASAVTNQSFVQFSLPAASKFEVSRKTVQMDVADGSKTERRAVMVTTIVVP